MIVAGIVLNSRVTTATEGIEDNSFHFVLRGIARNSRVVFTGDGWTNMTTGIVLLIFLDAA